MKTSATILSLLIAFMANAQFTYHHSFGLGYLGDDGGSCIAVDQSGNVYTAGSFETYLDMDPGLATVPVNGSGSADDFLAKYSSSGALLWAKAITSATDVGISLVAVDLAGNVYITGGFDGTVDFGGGALNTAGGTDLFVAKFDAGGQHSWSKSFGGTGDEISNSIDVTGNGSAIAICGSFEGTVIMGSDTIISNANTSYSNAFVATLDGSGNIQWAYGFGRTGFGFDRAAEVTFDISGNVYATGTFSGTNVDFMPGAGTQLLSSTGSSDIFFTKYTAAGVFDGAFHIGGAKGELAGGIDVAANGDIYFTGYSNSDSIDVDPEATTAYLYGITGILFVQDIIVVKFNSDAEYQWGFRIGRRDSDTGWEINLDAQGNVLVAGTMGDVNLDFDPGPNTYYLSSDSTTLNSSTTFLAHYTSGGDFMGAFALDSARINDLALSNDGKAWITGNFESNSIDLDPSGSTTAVFNNAGESDVFVAAYSYPFPVGIEPGEIHSLKIYPTLANDFVTIDADELTSTGTVEIRNSEGRIVFTEKANQMPHRISVKKLPAGIYMISCFSDEKIYSGKLVKTE